ncbi:hypothetical protein GCM10009613_61060 [Pseudonocardia kongjuensis]|uniref:HNH endonuclease n=1 Tax=Pseudonocardia kongjuensis TaxID=102227 RepID=A0ABP4J327_9PSEU
MPRATRPASGRGKAVPARDIPTGLRRLVLDRDLERCVRCGRHTAGIARSIQHRQARGQGGRLGAHTAANLILLCGHATTPGGCHAYAEDRSNWADTTSHGWVVSSFAPDPAAVPVFVQWLGWCWPGEQWTPCDDSGR